MSRVLEVSGLSFRYPDGTLALQDVNFHLHEGERVALIGPNGAGKSTLLFHLNGTFQGQGSVVVLGQELTSQSLYEIRKRVGLVFQDANDQLFMPTVFEDVAFGPMNLGYSEEEVKNRVQRALRGVGMEGTEGLTPHHLSVGQQKKVALASVLVMEPPILAFDEPSDGLDPRSRRGLIGLLQRLPQTQLIATHDLDLVLDICQRAIILDAGQLVYEGKVPEIFNQEKMLFAHGLEKPLRWQSP